MSPVKTVENKNSVCVPKIEPFRGPNRTICGITDHMIHASASLRSFLGACCCHFKEPDGRLHIHADVCSLKRSVVQRCAMITGASHCSSDGSQKPLGAFVSFQPYGHICSHRFTSVQNLPRDSRSAACTWSGACVSHMAHFGFLRNTTARCCMNQKPNFKLLQPLQRYLRKISILAS